MSHGASWQRHDLPDDVTLSHVVTGAFGSAMFGGNRGGGQACLVFTWPTLHVTDLGAERLMALTSNGAGVLAATADGVVHTMIESQPPSDGADSIDREDLPRDPAGHLPVMAWASSGDREFRLVLAYQDWVGHRLEIFSQEMGGLLENGNTLYGPQDLSGIQVTSNQGTLLVGGPVSVDPTLTHGCHVWSCSEPDFGGGEWAEQSLTPPPAALTHHVDGAVDWWWAGHDGRHLAIWNVDADVLSPQIAVDADEPEVYLAQTPSRESGPTVATHAKDSSSVRWVQDGRWMQAPLPPGQLTGALQSPRLGDPGPEVPERLHVLVDGVAWWMDWEVVRSLGR